MDLSDYVAILHRDPQAFRFVLLIERLLMSFVRPDKGHAAALHFPPMPSYYRLLIHAAAKTFNLRTGSRGLGDQRFTVVSLSKETEFPLLTVNELALPALGIDQRCTCALVAAHSSLLKSQQARNVLTWKEKIAKDENSSTVSGGRQPHMRQTAHMDEETDITPHRTANGTDSSTNHEIEILSKDIFQGLVSDTRNDEQKQRDRYSSARDGPGKKTSQNRSLLDHIITGRSNFLSESTSSDADDDMKANEALLAALGQECLGVRRCYANDTVWVAIFATSIAASTACENLDTWTTLGSALAARESVIGPRLGISRRPVAKAGNPLVLRRLLGSQGLSKEPRN